MQKTAGYQMVAIVVSLTLLLQAFVPAVMFVEVSSAGESPMIQETVAGAVDRPLTVARIQSGYQAGEEITITYIVHNNLPPTAVPEVPSGSSEGETTSILATFDPTTDANTLHDLVLAATLQSGTGYHDSSLPPAQSGDTFTWTLPDIPPYGRSLLTVTVQAPNSAPDFAPLDGGAAVSARLWDGQASARALPAHLIPDTLDPASTAGTVDADPFDEDLLWQAAGFVQDPTAAFEMVRAFRYDPYKGSLRGTRGTLWGKAGNSVDQSSLLIAMLRGAGIPARYRHGTLDSTDTQTLLASLFPAAQGLAGYLPEAGPVADPLADPTLSTLVQDHWWVEAYLPNQGWTDLDPSFPEAQAGDSFATPGSNDGIAELPDSLRHQVTLRLEVEQYNTFPVGGSHLSTFQPLAASYATAQIAAKPVSIGHFVTTEAAGAVFSSISHTYTPYFAVGGDDFLTAGDEFQDLLTTFPLATIFTTAEWITVETEDVDGNSTTFTREVKDLIGLDARFNGGTLDLQPPADNGPFTGFDDAFALWFLPNGLADAVYGARGRSANLYAVLESAATVAQLPQMATTPEETQAFNRARAEYFQARNQQYALGGLVFAELADPAVRDIEQNTRVKLYYDQPRIIIASSSAQPDGSVHKTMDLRSTEAAALVYPGQAAEADFTAQWLKAVVESYVEGQAIGELSGELPLTTAALFDEMHAQAIEPVLVTPAQMHLLDVYLPDSGAYVHAVTALLEGKDILIPQSPVLVDGKPTLGWWEIDPETGAAIGVLENGLHSAFIEYGTLAELLGFALALDDAAGFQTAVAEMWTCIARNVVPALQGNPLPPEDCVPTWFDVTPPWMPLPRPKADASARSPQAEAPSWRYLPAFLCPVANCGLEQFVLPYPDQSPMPLPEIAFGYHDRFGGTQLAGRVLAVADNGGSGSPALTLAGNPTSGSVLPGEEHSFAVDGSANFSGLVNVWAYAPAGWQVRFDETLQANVVARPGTPPGLYTIQLVGQPQDYPDVVVTAEHSVTIVDGASLDLAWEGEPNITIPLGDANFTAVSNQTNDGEAEIPESAFRLTISNHSAQARTVNLSVSGAPAGWIVLDGRQQAASSISLGPNERAHVGLYVLPPTLPTAGTAFEMVVAVEDSSGLGDSAVIPWTMPGQPHNYLQVVPSTFYLSAGSGAPLTLAMSNVGNHSGTFPLALTTPLAEAGLTNLQAPLLLAPGASQAQTATLTIGARAPHGRFPLIFSSSPAGNYTQYALAEVFVLTKNAGKAAAAAACTLEESALGATLQSLALAMDALESGCGAGTCSPATQDQTVAALESAISSAEFISPHLTVIAALQALAGDLGAQGEPEEILATLDSLGMAIEQLGLELCEVSEHRPAARFSPYRDARLVGESAAFTLTVSNEGSVETGYDVSVDTPTGVQTFNPILAPGSAVELAITTMPAQPGSYDLLAEVVPVAPDVALPITETAVARLNVVDKFVQVTAVTADPPFVESGAGSTALGVEVANVAGIRQVLVADTEILAPDGSVQWDAKIPLTLLAGNPRTYDLAAVDTSGWHAGVYTLTVDLGLPEGHGYGYLAVGQGLGAAHEVGPLLVPPGTALVTTTISTELVQAPILPPAGAQPLHPWPQRSPLTPYTAPVTQTVAAQSSGENPPPERATMVPAGPAAPLSTWAISRTESSAAAITYSGAWTALDNATAALASNNDYAYSQTAGDTATFSFSGTWVAVGFVSSSQSGYAELFVDGASQGQIDLYSNGNDLRRVTLSGLADTAHTLTITVVGGHNPFGNGKRVIVDYVDSWDGTDMPAGSFEQDGGRVWLSGGWLNQSEAGASGGSYYRNGHAAWFPFTGDSLTFQALTHGTSEKIALYLDDDFRGYYDLSGWTVHTRTFSFDGLGAGPHVLTVRAFRGAATIDSFSSPATEPPTPPPAAGSFRRYEENDAALLYNGAPFGQTATSWSSGFNDSASDHYAYLSGTPGDTVEFAFTGPAVIVGFYAERRGGYAEIFLDGASQGVVDTYRRDPTTLSLPFYDLTDGPHTLAVTVLGQANPAATTDNVYLDYVDVWDGTPLAGGTFEELDGRIERSYRWSLLSSTEAGGGQYLQDAITGAAGVWFPFSGDSVSLHTIAGPQGSRTTKVLVDGQAYSTVNLYHNTTVSRTFSFAGFGEGLHVLHLERYRGELAVDAFTAPGVPPFVEPPTLAGVVRFEEDDPALRYNGVPYPQRPQSWTAQAQTVASGGYSALSSTGGDSVSLTFSGRWVSAGFFTHVYGGQAEIFIDGASQGTIALYSAANDVTSFTVGDLLTGTHTLSITVLGQPAPPSTQARVHLDYVDVWDGQTMDDALANASLAEDNGRIFFGERLTQSTNPNAIGGESVDSSAGSPDANVWYAFTGDSFTYYGFSRSQAGAGADVYVDGQFLETVNLTYPFSEQPLAFSFDNLGAGPHVARINNNANFRVDAFASNQAEIGYRPLAEWWESERSRGASLWGGLHVPVAVGDVTGDGAVELVVASSNLDNNGELFLMRGDGQDAGGGDPILWSVPFNIFNGFENVGAPAIANLDGQPGAEIVLATTEGMYAFHSDGSSYWFTDTHKPHVFFGTPAIGNLDLDPEPEIVINMDETLVVFEQDGAIAWTFADGDGLTMPLLADLTGDGLLDILVHDWDDTLYLYDYNLGAPQLVWTAVFTNPLHGYGAPAVADLDGDGTVEVALASETRLFALNGEDGSVHWSAALDPGATGGVTGADIDGDGAVELVTSSLFDGGTLYAFEADGTRKWAVPALDGSHLNTSAADLDGDGAFELLWNGAGQGFTIYDGQSGAILFNEPLAASATGSDVPVAADVDGDGFAEVVVPAQGGVRVFGFDGVWGPARPLWNQLNYHITNVDDDLSVPFAESDSWQVHNSYRAQTDLVHPLPDYSVSLTYTAGSEGISLLPGTFGVPPTWEAPPHYGWHYGQDWTIPRVTRSFQSEVSGLQPGETRQVAAGTEVAYTLSGGANRLALPPLYVTAARPAALEPAFQSRPAGSNAVYTLTLTNLADSAATYDIQVAGPLAPWVEAPLPITVPAGSEVSTPLAVVIPATAVPQTLPLLLTVDDGHVPDELTAELAIVDGVDVAINPAVHSTSSGEAAAYTLTITNSEEVDQRYSLSASGLAAVTLPGDVVVPAGQTVDVAFTASATHVGPQPFTVQVAAGSGASDGASAVVDVQAASRVSLSLAPDPAVTGPGSTAVLALLVRNTGSLPDTFDLDVRAPAGWEVQLQANGQTVETVTLPPFVYNSRELMLLITPPPGTQPGDYAVTATAVAQSSPTVGAGSSSTVQVLERGVQLTLLSGPSMVDPRTAPVWQVRVANTGQVADTFDLEAAGLFALDGAFAGNAVTLAPGQSQTVAFTAGSLESYLPDSHELVVAARSRANSSIVSQDMLDVSLLAYEAVEAALVPLAQTAGDAPSGTFTLILTNTGNATTRYQLSGDVPGATLRLAQTSVQIPAHLSAAVLLTVTAPGAGTYVVAATAASAGGTTGVAGATLTVPGAPSVDVTTYLPVVRK